MRERHRLHQFRVPGAGLISVRVVRMLDVVPSRPGERAFVAAASGLCESNGRLFVVADDEHTLVVFPADSNGPGVRHLLLRPDAHDHSQMPKKHKPDLEAICILPNGDLLALPSGSTPNRQAGAVVSLHDGQPAVPSRAVDFTPLFDRLRQETPQLNLEGAAVFRQSLWLAQRGNNATPNALFEVDLRRFCGDEVPATAFVRSVPLNLGDIDGIPLTPTDLCALPDGRIVVSAVCEDTADAYLDGKCSAAALAVVEPGHPILHRLERIEPNYKVEGLLVRPDGVVWMVCDADNPALAAPLLEGRLE